MASATLARITRTSGVYNESKHGIIYRAKVDEMNLESDKWVAGIDYTAAPTCATCHGRAAVVTNRRRTTWVSASRGPCARRCQRRSTWSLENGQEFDVKEGGALPKVGDEAKGFRRWWKS